MDDLDSDSDDDVEEIDEGEQGIYPKINYEEPAMPKLNNKQNPTVSLNKQQTEKEALINNDPKPDETNVPFVPTDPSAVDSKGSNKSILKLIPKKLIPKLKILQSESSDPVVAAEEAEKKRLIEEQKQRAKEEKRQQKELRKKINAERKEELRKQAAIERRRRSLSTAIDLLLTYLRLMTTFAMLVGNIHKTFMPRYLEAPGEDIIDNPDLITMSLDILLFWTMMFWTYYRQCRLCCRLGCLKFWLWLITLGLIGGLGMYMPMHYIYDQLDPTWCVFLTGTPLSEYFDG